MNAIVADAIASDLLRLDLIGPNLAESDPIQDEFVRGSVLAAVGLIARVGEGSRP